MSKRLGTIVFSVVIIILSVIAIWITNSFRVVFMQYDLGPGGFPKFACTAMILLALITIIKELRGRGNEKLNLINTKTLLHFGLITLYVILLPYLGFVLNSLWVMPSMMVIMGASKPVKIILISASFITFLYIIFAYLLKVPLPLGVLEPIFR